MKTLSLRKEDVDKKWVLIDAEGIVLGRLASKVSMILRGKHKPSFTPHADCGDHVIIINAEKVKFTGKKLDGKIYYWHTGHPGGIKSRTARQIIEGKFPDRVIRMAVKRMIPKGPLGSVQLSNMKVYAGSIHGMEAQKPEVLDVASMNPKNTRTS